MKTSEIACSIYQELNQITAINDADFNELFQQIEHANHIFLSGAGRSLLMIKAFAMRLMHLGYQVYMLGDVTTPAIQSNDLLIVASGSGSTASLIQKAEKAKAIGAATTLITRTPDSKIGAFCNHIVTLPINESKQPGASLFEQSLLIALDAFIMFIIDQLHLNADIVYKRHANLE